ncbi:MAG: endoribonuclease MazF [Chitinispirillales bacterium]|jgi:mRNA interferase MazF|nr:endoribonuclease MazF [Chitinispirillales bacterium]
MVRKKYIPERGDIVWLNFTPQAGHEQRGKRPAIVVSPKEYNEKTGLGLFCPITSKIKGYPFEVEIKNKKITGVVLSDQIKSLDWRIREAEFIIKETTEKMDEIIDKISVLLY